jgi:hypothetical protein
MLDIGLTIWAWNRGWKAWALLPIAVTFFIFFLMSAAGALDAPLIILVILAELGSLIYMIARPRKKSQPATASNLYSPAAPVNIEPHGRPVRVEPATVIEPATILAPLNRAKFVLPDNNEISLIGATRTIGRSDLNGAISPAALKYISRQHLLVRSDNGRYFIEDKDSANGTKINGANIRGKGRQALTDGDRVDVAGVTTLTFKTSGLP